MKVPEVSVVMSAFNGARRLPETVDSVLSQESVALEFIVVDDGSTDETASLLARYANLDARVKVITQENQGLTRALIKGCAAATGKYIARQDVGDVSRLRRLYSQLQALESDRDLGFVSCWTEFCGPEWEFLYQVKGTGRAVSPAYVISTDEKHAVIDGPTHHGSVMFRKDVYSEVGGYRGEFYYGQDWDLWFRIAERAKFQVVEQSLYKARLVPASISAYGKRKQALLSHLSTAALLQRLKGLPEQRILEEASRIGPSEIGRKSARHEAEWLYFIGECLRKNKDRRSRSYFARSIQTYPLNPGAWLRLIQATVHLL